MFLLVSALSFAMLRVFQVCVNINLLLERDARVLADAAVDALTRQGPHEPRAGVKLDFDTSKRAYTIDININQ